MQQRCTQDDELSTRTFFFHTFEKTCIFASPIAMEDSSAESEASPGAAAGRRDETLRNETSRVTTRVPSLVELASDVVAAHAHMLLPEHLEHIGEKMTALLLFKIIRARRLDFTIAKTFLGCTFSSIQEALKDVDLLAGISAVPQTPCRPM